MRMGIRLRFVDPTGLQCSYSGGIPCVEAVPLGPAVPAPIVGRVQGLDCSDENPPVANPNDACVESNPTGPIGGAYLRWRAVLWADQNAEHTIDPNYRAYEEDCAHFLSTALFNGGLDVTQGWTYKGSEPGLVRFWNRRYGSPAWRIVAAQYTYFLGEGHLGHDVPLIRGMDPKVGPPGISAGDLVYFDWADSSGPANHGTLVVGRAPDGELLLDHHNNGSIGRLRDPFSKLILRARSQNSGGRINKNGEIPAHYVRIDR